MSPLDGIQFTVSARRSRRTIDCHNFPFDYYLSSSKNPGYMCSTGDRQPSQTSRRRSITQQILPFVLLYYAAAFPLSSSFRIRSYQIYTSLFARVVQKGEALWPEICNKNKVNQWQLLRVCDAIISSWIWPSLSQTEMGLEIKLKKIDVIKRPVWQLNLAVTAFVLLHKSRQWQKLVTKIIENVVVKTRKAVVWESDEKTEDAQSQYY